ncbi:hypothetical protein [Devosia sp. CAU 1758]
MNRNTLIAIVVAVAVVIFAFTIFTSINQAPETDGAQTANELIEQQELPAGPADEPAELTQ